MRRYHLIFNARSGTALSQGMGAEALGQRFRDAGLPVTIDDDRDLSLTERLEQAVKSDGDVVIAAGGDGTVTAVARAIVGTGKSLAILPLGTMNLLARDLSIPLEVEEWISALPTMEPRPVDLGEVNGRIFLHKVVAGVFPGITAGREQIRNKRGLAAKAGFLMFFFRRLLRARRMTIDLSEPGRPPRRFRVAAIAVANNQYDEGPGRFFSRARLDRGNLTVYLLKQLTIGDLVRLAIGMIVGKWRRDEALHIEATRAVRLRTGKRKLHVMLDGEVEIFDAPLDFRIRPLALPILAPPLAAAGAGEPAQAAGARLPRDPATAGE